MAKKRLRDPRRNALSPPQMQNKIDELQHTVDSLAKLSRAYEKQLNEFRAQIDKWQEIAIAAADQKFSIRRVHLAGHKPLYEIQSLTHVYNGLFDTPVEAAWYWGEQQAKEKK